MFVAGLQLFVVLMAAIKAPWKAIVSVPSRVNLLFGVGVMLALFPLAGFRLGTTLDLHLLGVTTATLVLGPMLTLLVGSVAAAGLAIWNDQSWFAALVAACVNVTLPVMMTWALLRVAMRYGPRNPFVFFLGVGFAGGIVSMAAVCLVGAIPLWLSGAPATPGAVMLLLAYAEGLVNGALVSAGAVYLPHWMRAYDERHFEVSQP
jgi:uncharacterized membrane protein